MILLFPTLIEGINTKEGREAFKAQSHMFYTQRVVDIKDGLPKFSGLSDKSDHISSFVHDGCSAVAALYLAREVVCR